MDYIFKLMTLQHYILERCPKNYIRAMQHRNMALDGSIDSNIKLAYTKRKFLYTYGLTKPL